MHVDQKFQVFGCTDKPPQLLYSVIGVAGSFILGVGYIEASHSVSCLPAPPGSGIGQPGIGQPAITIFMDHEYL